MTDSSIGLDALESRFQRRKRSIRPPRRPREQAQGSADESREGEDSPQSETPTEPPAAPLAGATTGQADEAELAHSGDQPPEEGVSAGQPHASVSEEDRRDGIKAEQLSPEDEGADGHRREGSPDGQQPGIGTLSEILQQHITDAVAPVMADLQQQIADAVREQMQQAQTDQLDEPDVPEEEAEPPESANRPAQEPISAANTESEHGPEAENLSPLQAVMRSTIAALRQTLQWLTRTMRRLLPTLTNPLRAVVSFLRLIVAKLGEAFGWVFHLIGQAGSVAANRLWVALKTLLARLIQKFVLSPLQ